MEVLRILQEKYIDEFSNNVPIGEFLFNIVVTAVLIVLLRWFYIRYGAAISNRRKFGNNFLPLALGTLLIIMIVKSSIALSLGLVGALSIVRFRAAIKDPEELTYLFIAIGIGLAGGANQPILAVVSVVLILAILFIHKRTTGQLVHVREDRMFVNIQTDVEDLDQIVQLLTSTFPFVELKRMDTLEKGLDLSFICKATDLAQLSEAKNKLRALSPATRLSIVDQPDLII
ncbi:MAG: DUF4956 domain-containing protein [Saprospiraceae bacterium]|nr:DUF4956 domain-containing protein [Saprospiraceae bacterium]